jgi:hypothetical protein
LGDAKKVNMPPLKIYVISKYDRTTKNITLESDKFYLIHQDVVNRIIELQQEYPVTQVKFGIEEYILLR